MERIPRGRELRGRLESLEPDTRQHIAHEVRQGRALREREWAALAAAVARIRRREVLILALLTPGLILAVSLVGTVGGRWSRGADPAETALVVLGWHGGIAWPLIWVGLTALLLLATHRHRARLKRAEQRNRERASTRR
jgi:hypothetical protein